MNRVQHLKLIAHELEKIRTEILILRHSKPEQRVYLISACCNHLSMQIGLIEQLAQGEEQ